MTVASFESTFGSEWRWEEERMACIHLHSRNKEPQTWNYSLFDKDGYIDFY